MFDGELVAIFITSARGSSLCPVETVEAVAGRGLRNDRYFLPEGKVKPSTEITLIESEALDALAAEYSICLEPSQSRRNLLTRGAPLNHLVGKEFHVGLVRLRGIELCEPCGHLQRLTADGVKKGLCHRGGLRAQILGGGVLRVGDAIRPLPAE